MILKFKSIHMKNFLSFEDSEVTLDRNGYIVISGKNENPDDCAKSNGAGKSSIPEAIIWTLSGETMRGTKDVKRYNSDEKCECTLKFSVDGKEYEVTRSKDPSNLFLYVEGENKSGKGIRDTEKILSEYLPELTAQLLGSVIVMGQGLPMRFTNNSPSGRKDVLEKLSKSDFMIEDLKDRVNKRKSELCKDKRQKEDDILKHETLISSKESDIKRYDDSINAEKAINYDSLINDKITVLNEFTELIDTTTKNLKEIQEKLAPISDKLRELANAKYKEINDISSEFDKQYAEKNELYNQSRMAENSLQTEIYKIDNIKTVCPTCGQKLEGVVKPDSTPLKEKLVEQKKKTTKYHEEMREIQNKKTLKCNEIATSYASEESLLEADDKKLKNEQSSLTNRLNSCTSSASSVKNEIDAITISKNNHEYRLKQLNESKILAEEAKKESETAIVRLKSDLDILNSRLSVISKFEIALKRDFRGILLSNIIKYIDFRAKEYSKIVFGTEKLDFILDGNNISISYNGREYENLSGGEKQRVDLIIQFALRDMLCKYLNFSSNILVLDEIIDNLDAVGCQKVMELISAKLNDVGSVYIISHHADIPMPVDYEILVVKGSNGISKVIN